MKHVLEWEIVGVIGFCLNGASTACMMPPMLFSIYMDGGVRERKAEKFV